MKSIYGKVAIIAVLLVAIVGVVQLKQRQGATTLPQVTATQEAQATAPSPPVTAVSPTAPSPKTTPAVPTKKTPVTAPKPVTTPAHTPLTRKAPAATPPVKTATALPRLLELGSDSCRPCQMMQPVLAALRADYAGKLRVDFIDVWKDTSAGDKYGIQAIPTQIFFDASGKEVFRHTGYYPKEDILAKFKECGISL